MSGRNAGREVESRDDTFIDASTAIDRVAAPVARGPPVPLWPTVIIKPETVRGVGTLFVNLILDIIFGICALVVGVTAVVVATSTDPIAAVGFLATLGAATCGLVIVFIINFILSLHSVLRIHHGANEYGPEHQANARRGVAFKWLGTSLSTFAAILLVYLTFVGSSSLLFGGGVPPTLYVPLLITLFWTAGVSAKAQMYRFMVRSLQPAETRRWSDIASIAIPALGIVGISLVGYHTARLVALFTSPGAVTSVEATQSAQIMIGGVFLPPGLALVGYIVFLAVYGRTRDRLSQGLSTLYASLPQPVAWTSPAPIAGIPPLQATPRTTPSTGEGSCFQCGYPYPAGALFCLNCGTRRAPDPSRPA
jgi:hypothetical protein